VDARSARTGGFADTLLSTLGELEQGMLDPGDLAGDLAQLYAGYRAELDRLKLWDRDLLRRRAAGETLRALAVDYQVAHTSLGRWFKRPQVASQLRAAKRHPPTPPTSHHRPKPPTRN